MHDDDTPPSAPIEAVGRPPSAPVQNGAAIATPLPDHAARALADALRHAAALCAVLEPAAARRRARPPIRTSSEGHDGTPSAPVETEADAHRRLLPAPTAEEVHAARLAAGHTQRAAATVIGASRWQTWSDYEGGRKPMSALSWTWYLLVTGQHPGAKLIRASR